MAEGVLFEMPYIMENGRLYYFDAAGDSSIRYNGISFSSGNTTNIAKGIVESRNNETARCLYCNTKALDGERQCIACGAPL